MKNLSLIGIKISKTFGKNKNIVYGDIGETSIVFSADEEAISYKKRYSKSWN